MLKLFKTHNKQLKVLRKKGLNVPTGIPKRTLEKEGYYQVINGYKDLFILTRKTTTTSEVFKPNSKFSEIHSLYNFDYEIKMIILKRILKIENQLKNQIAYLFSELYGHDNYLKTKNFDCSTQNKLAEVMSLIKDLQSDIAKDIGKKPPITHYMTTYGYVPLWVLMPFLTFGRVGHFYKHMIQRDRQSISKQYALPDSELNNMIHMLTMVRNCCAHDSRLYNFKTKKHLSTNSYHRHTSLGVNFIGNEPQQGRNDLFAILIIFKYFLDKREFTKLTTEIKKQIDELQQSLHTINITDVLNEMGFPANWLNLKSI